MESFLSVNFSVEELWHGWRRHWRQVGNPRRSISFDAVHMAVFHSYSILATFLLLFTLNSILWSTRMMLMTLTMWMMSLRFAFPQLYKRPDPMFREITLCKQLNLLGFGLIFIQNQSIFIKNEAQMKQWLLVFLMEILLLVGLQLVLQKGEGQDLMFKKILFSFQEVHSLILAMKKKLRVAFLVGKAAFQFTHGVNLSSNYTVPEEENAAGFQIFADGRESAGITDRMVTGDNLNIGKAIAKEYGNLTDKGLANESKKFQENSEEELPMQAFNWSQIPDEVTSIVVNQLTTIEDFAASSQVCRHLRSACSEMNWTQGLQPPWLMLSENPNSKKRWFFSLYNNLCYELELPTVCGRRCYGTAQGWIIAVGPDLQAHLLHPLDREKKDLPALYALQNEVGVLTDWFNLIQKFIAFKMSDDQFLVMAIYGPSSYLAYAKTGDSEWVIVEDVCQVKDVNFFQGCFYALCWRGVLMLCELNGPDSVVHHVDRPPRDLETTDKMYLVESSGKLYAVFRYGSVDVSDKGYKTRSFLVYKFQFNLPDNCPNPRWARVKDLEDCAIFVGDCNSWSICGSNIVNCKMNCIYFTDDNWGQQKTIGGTYEGHDIGVFDMASKKIEYLHFGVDTPSDYSRPIWFRPTLQHKEGSRPIWLTTTVPQ